MRVFSTLSLLAVVSSALFASAAPLETSPNVGVNALDDAHNVGGTVSTSNTRRDGSLDLEGNAPVQENAGNTGNVVSNNGVGVDPEVPVDRRDLIPDESLPVILVGVNTELAKIAAKIGIAIGSGIDIKVNLVIGYVDELKNILTDGALKAQGLAKTHTQNAKSKALDYQGQVLGAVGVARLLAITVELVFQILALVSSVSITIAAPIIGQIAISLGIIITSVVAIAGGAVLPTIVRLIQFIVPSLGLVGLGDVLRVLHI